MKHVFPAAIAFAWAMSAALAAQTGGTAQAQMAETVFKNIQVLKGIPVDDFLDTMGIMSAALGFDCAECHRTPAPMPSNGKPTPTGSAWRGG